MAFEPFLQSRSILEKNLRVNTCSEVTVSGSALSNVTTMGSIPSFDSKNYGNVTLELSEAGQILMAKLDDFAPKDMRVTMIKIDVEGSERKVLEGASQTLLRHSDTDVALVLHERGSDGKTLMMLAGLAYYAYLDTGIMVQPVPIAIEDWLTPSAFPRPGFLRNVQREGIEL